MTGAEPNHRHLRALARGMLIVAVVAASVALLLAVAPLDSISDEFGHLRVSWLLLAVAFEVGSCLCYPVVFRRFFPEPPAGVSRRVAWMAMGAGAVLPGGNISSAAATGLLLRRHGIGALRLAGRCTAIVFLLTLFGFFVNGVVGLALLAHLPGGPHDLLRAGGPVLVSVVVLGGAGALMGLTRRRGDPAPRIVQVAAHGLHDAWLAARRPSVQLAGAAGFLLLDIAALWAATVATGHPIGVPALMLAYFIGYLATLLPVPAGIGVLDSGLAGMLVVYGMHGSYAVTAVLAYHAISVWVPGVGGLYAWIRTGRAEGAGILRRRRTDRKPASTVAG